MPWADQSSWRRFADQIRQMFCRFRAAAVRCDFPRRDTGFRLLSGDIDSNRCPCVQLFPGIARFADCDERARCRYFGRSRKENARRHDRKVHARYHAPGQYPQSNLR